MSSRQDYLRSMFTANGERKYVTQNEVKRFLVCARAHGEAQYLLCHVLAYSGIRLSEAINLTVQSVDLELGAIIVRTLKQDGKTIYRALPMPQRSLKRLLKLAKTQDCQRFWPIHRMTAYRWLKAIMQEADLDGAKATSRGLRHGFAIQNLESEISFHQVNDWLGHSELKTTMIYTKFAMKLQHKLAQRRWRMIES